MSNQIKEPPTDCVYTLGIADQHFCALTEIRLTKAPSMLCQDHQVLIGTISFDGNENSIVTDGTFRDGYIYCAIHNDVQGWRTGNIRVNGEKVKWIDGKQFLIH